ncbi:hypothetical protein [Labilithrix luteola]|nr:hypothetical protein [Labilithrix luteola]
MQALLERFEQIASPGAGAPVLFLALARLATTACDWLDGELRVELTGDDAKTRISVSTTIGGGFREKAFRDAVLGVPFAEFNHAALTMPKLIEPLVLSESGKRIVLVASSAARKTSLPPPMVTIDPSSFVEIPKYQAPYAGSRPHGVNLPPRPRMETLLGLDDPGLAHEPQHAAPAEPKIVLRRRVREESGSK